MVCGMSCSVAIAFVVAMIYFYGATNTSQLAKNYQASLSPELRSKYSQVVAERTKLAYQGYGLGIIIAILFLWYYRYNKIKMSNTSTVCLVVSIMFATNYFYYMLSPKTTYMLDYLKNEEDIKQWLQMYRGMQFNYHVGLLFGIASAGATAWAFRC